MHGFPFFSNTKHSPEIYYEIYKFNTHSWLPSLALAFLNTAYSDVLSAALFTKNHIILPCAPKPQLSLQMKVLENVFAAGG